MERKSVEREVAKEVKPRHLVLARPDFQEAYQRTVVCQLYFQITALSIAVILLTRSL